MSIKIPSGYINDPFGCEDLDPEDIAPAAGEVKTYFLPKEEIEKRYGHLRRSPAADTGHKKQRTPKKPEITKEYLMDKLRTRTVNQVAFVTGVGVETIISLCELFGLALNEKGRLKYPDQGEEAPTVKRTGKKKAKMQIAKERIPKELLIAELKSGKTNKEIAVKYDVPGYAVSHLKSAYGLNHLLPNKPAKKAK